MSAFVAGLVLGALLGVIAATVATLLTRQRALREQAQLERRAAQNERLAELGMLTGGLAHEIKNPLSTLQLNLQLLREDLDAREAALPVATDDTEVEERRKALHRMTRRLDAVTNESGRLREILDDFLRYAGQIQPEPRPVDLVSLCEELVDFLHPQAQQAGVQLRVEPAATVNASVDPRLIQQAVLNLALNAIQHTPAGGTVAIRLDTLTQAFSTNDRKPRSAVQVSVTDTGEGIDAETKAKILQPYFSRRRGGTGLGLAVTRRIVEAHGGKIVIESEPGKGSTFAIVLPAESTTAAEVD
ncbi:MAG: ATP-binding protein [Planctomycetota bacterium]